MSSLSIILSFQGSNPVNNHMLKESLSSLKMEVGRKESVKT